MAWGGTVLNKNDLQLSITVPDHLTLQLSAGNSNVVSLIPHCFSLSQLIDLLHTVTTTRLLVLPMTPGLVLFGKDGQLMTIRSEEDLRQVYYWHRFAKLHQPQQLPPTRRWGRLPHHVTIWLRRQPGCRQGNQEVVLLAPRTDLSYSLLMSACAKLLGYLDDVGYNNRKLHSSPSGSSASVSESADHSPMVLCTSSINGECQICLDHSNKLSGRSDPVSTALIRDQSVYASLCSSICCCELKFHSSTDSDHRGSVATMETEGADTSCDTVEAEALANRQWSLDDFDFGQERVCLGVGQFGTVHLAMCKLTNKPVALKSIDLCSLGGRGGFLDDAEVERLMLELKLLSDCRHENIVSYVCSFFQQSQARLFICTEVMDAGSLDKLGLGDELVLGYVSVCAINGLSYLWHRCIVHRDVKLANILACRRGRVKICDLGLAKEANPMPPATTVATQVGVANLPASTCVASSFCGSYEYMSPERVKAKRYGHLADVWSLGVALYELACGRVPFGGRGALLSQMLNDIRQARVPPMPAAIAGALSSEFHQLYTACLQRKPKHRPSKLTIKSCPFYAKYASLSVSETDGLREHFKSWVASALSRVGR